MRENRGSEYAVIGGEGRGGMGSGWSLLVLGGTLFGAVLSPALTSVGMAQLAVHRGATGWSWLFSTLAGGLAGAATVATAHRADIWGLAPALVIWATALVAAASCDAVTQRIPTALVRQATVAVGVLLSVGLALHRDWAGLVLSGVASLAGGLTMLVCWRVAGAGFGDVRLAVLGGLGLGHATPNGLVLGLAAFTVVTGVQAGVALARGGTRRTLIPFGPALAAGFLVAAAI